MFKYKNKILMVGIIALALVSGCVEDKECWEWAERDICIEYGEKEINCPVKVKFIYPVEWGEQLRGEACGIDDGIVCIELSTGNEYILRWNHDDKEFEVGISFWNESGRLGGDSITINKSRYPNCDFDSVTTSVENDPYRQEIRSYVISRVQSRSMCIKTEKRLICVDER